MASPPPIAIIDAFAGTQRFVLDYLAAEVLGAAGPRPPHVPRADLGRRALHGGAVPGADRSRGQRGPARAGRATNLFLIPLDLERRWYRFHHLFADYLRTLLDPAEQVALHERAADYLEAEGLFEEAIAHALAAGSTDRAIRLLERQGRRTYEAGELTTLLGWLDALPRDRVAASPELVYLRAVACFFVGRVEDAARTCDEGEAACPCDASPGPLLTACALIAAFSNRPDATDLGRAAVEAIGDDRFFRARALQALATAYLAAGELESAGETARSALDLEAGSRRSTLVVPATTALVTALNLTGHRRDAEALCRQCLADHRAEVSHMAGGTPYALYWLGIVRYEANDLAEAVDALERAWAAAGTFGFGRALLTTAVSYLALARQATGSPEGALDAVRTVRRDARAAGLDGVDDALDEIEARVRLLQGDLPAAARWADAVGRVSGRGAWRLGPGRPGAGHHRWRGSGSRRAGPRTPGASLDAARAAAVGRERHRRPDLGRRPRRRAGGGSRQPGGRAARARGGDPAGRAGGIRAPRGRRRAPRRPPAAGRAQGRAGVRRRGHGRARRVPAPAALPGRHAGPSLWRDEEGQPVEALTARELEVLRLMARGSGDAAIADELVVSLATAKWHAAHIRSKLGAKSRTQALLRAQELGLV